MSDERYSRNEGLFGAEGQKTIAAKKVVIIGLGGLGSHVAQQLAYLGVQDYALVDYDIVTESSMNRLIGAVEADVDAATKKVTVAKRMIEGIDPTATVADIDGKIDDAEVEAAIAAADVVFGCLDRDLPRLKLTELCARYAKPLFDLATDTGGEAQDLWYGGRVVFANGAGCLVCLHVLDQQEIARDGMSPEQREAHDRIYGVERGALGETGPMVVSVNGVVASLAVTEFMVFVTGVRDPVPQLIYRGEGPVIRRVTDEPEPGCYFCTGIWGSAGSSGFSSPPSGLILA
jgi:molybdopterin-synthase adenylyltransferase